MLNSLNKQANKQLSTQPNKQNGATLITALMMLLVMTLLGVAAIKMSILDMLIAGNDQQRMLLYQETHTTLSELAITNRLSTTLTVDGFVGTANQEYVFAIDPAKTGIRETITDMQERYPCERAGISSSIGPNAPVCDLYDFQINAKKATSGVTELHHRGSGKMVPKPGSHADATSGNAVLEDD